MLDLRSLYESSLSFMQTMASKNFFNQVRLFSVIFLWHAGRFENFLAPAFDDIQELKIYMNQRNREIAYWRTLRFLFMMWISEMLFVIIYSPDWWALLKITKNIPPLDPIYRNAQFISEAFVPFLKIFLPPPSYVIDSTTELIRKIKDVTVIHNSLDIVSLYPFMVIKEIVKIIEDSIDNIQSFNKDICRSR